MVTKQWFTDLIGSEYHRPSESVGGSPFGFGDQTKVCILRAAMNHEVCVYTYVYIYMCVCVCLCVVCIFEESCHRGLEKNGIYFRSEH